MSLLKQKPVKLQDAVMQCQFRKFQKEWKPGFFLRVFGINRRIFALAPMAEQSISHSVHNAKYSLRFDEKNRLVFLADETSFFGRIQRKTVILVPEKVDAEKLDGLKCAINTILITINQIVNAIYNKKTNLQQEIIIAGIIVGIVASLSALELFQSEIVLFAAAVLMARLLAKSFFDVLYALALTRNKGRILSDFIAINAKNEEDSTKKV